MAGTPRTTVDDHYVTGLACAICGQPELYVQHLPDYPDFVTCRHCEAAFVVEESGERVLYGKIPDAYPETKEFALRQWVWLEAVERRASEERRKAEPPPARAPEEAIRAGWVPEAEMTPEPGEAEEEAEALPEPEAPARPDPDWLAARLQAGSLGAGVPIPTEPDPYRAVERGVPLGSDTGPTEESLPAWLRESAPPEPAPMPEPVRPSPPAPMPAARVAPAAAPAQVEGAEPSPHERHRVVIRGDRVRVPVNACAHCQRSPAPDRLPVPGSLPRAGDPARRRTTMFQVPLCRECSQRATARSAEARSGALMAHLTGALVGLVLVVGLLAFGVISFAGGIGIGLLTLGVAWFIGYGLTAAVLLRRAAGAASTPDAAFVRSTLRVVPDASPGQTAFEWRNRLTAANFHQANGMAAVGSPAVIPESSA